MYIGEADDEYRFILKYKHKLHVTMQIKKNQYDTKTAKAEVEWNIFLHEKTAFKELLFSPCTYILVV